MECENDKIIFNREYITTAVYGINTSEKVIQISCNKC